MKKRERQQKQQTEENREVALLEEAIKSNKNLAESLEATNKKLREEVVASKKEVTARKKEVAASQKRCAELAAQIKTSKAEDT
ncbi:hypothetical protein DID88_002019 [Monilinia fructigena]|uniref:Uncharacterized protein n=1 Tax=Monilinia fructigena TaxID=38457 RepID=A0A395IW61_9HELO|nr:hypothetical protein DID88_002019 [Monilinia fructigena]